MGGLWYNRLYTRAADTGSQLNGRIEMAKTGGSKTDVTKRAKLKARLSICRFCGKTPDVVRVLTPAGKAQMHRKCCAAAGIAA